MPGSSCYDFAHHNHPAGGRRARAPPAGEARGKLSQDPTRSELRRRIYSVVARIPRGHVATYGQVAALAGAPRHARQVGYALHDLPAGSSLPWHRVINARGEVSPRSEPGWEAFQRQLLEGEGVEFRRGRVELERYRWEPPEGPGAPHPGDV